VAVARVWWGLSGQLREGVLGKQLRMVVSAGVGKGQQAGAEQKVESEEKKESSVHVWMHHPLGKSVWMLR